VKWKTKIKFSLPLVNLDSVCFLLRIKAKELNLNLAEDFSGTRVQVALESQGQKQVTGHKSKLQGSPSIFLERDHLEILICNQLSEGVYLAVPNLQVEAYQFKPRN
jgi:hypothetical protein